MKYWCGLLYNLHLTTRSECGSVIACTISDSLNWFYAEEKTGMLIGIKLNLIHLSSILIVFPFHVQLYTDYKNSSAVFWDLH